MTQFRFHLPIFFHEKCFKRTTKELAIVSYDGYVLMAVSFGNDELCFLGNQVNVGTGPLFNTDISLVTRSIAVTKPEEMK
jgi:hypothetical protein